MRTEIDMGAMAEVMVALDHYNTLLGVFNQLDKSESLKTFWKKIEKTKIVGKSEILVTDYQTMYEAWKNINLYVVSQGWSNTSCGWESIGGCMMSDAYTTIIENRWNNAIFVYYSGKLAYIAEYDEKLLACKANGFSNLPGVRSLSGYNIVYRNIR